MENIFDSEEQFLNLIENHDQLIQDCASGQISFDEFLRQYNNFYYYYALDGHESIENERALFERHENRIKPHAELASEILSNVCSNDDAVKQSYLDAGGFGSEEASRRIKELVAKYFKRKF